MFPGGDTEEVKANLPHLPALLRARSGLPSPLSYLTEGIFLTALWRKNAVGPCM